MTGHDGETGFVGTCRMGIDIGGTFTDVAVVGADGELRIGKVLTTPGRETVGVLAAVDASKVSLAEINVLAHGTTLVINSLIQRHGARTALVTTEGFADVHEIGRGNRPEISNLFYQRDPVLVPRELRLELAERTRADGTVKRVPTEDELAELVARLRALEIEACAVAFLNAYANPANEELVAAHLAEALPGVFVTRATALSRQWREYERTTTAAANAYVGPALRSYADALDQALAERGFTGDFVFLASNGGAMSAASVAEMPVRVVESGPAGGAVGAQSLARELGIENVVTLDIGGTTAKSCLIEAGRFGMAEVFWVGGAKRGLPLQVPTIDVLEVGAGGGSVVWVGPGGNLRVGPRSAGAQPGPACYGLGGSELTVTDANVFCGRLSPRYFEGAIDIYPELADIAVRRLSNQLGVEPARLALGVLEISAAAMGAAVRRQTLERGRVPADFALVAYGGGGPLHACDIAADVGIRTVLVPPAPGVFSSLGMLGIDVMLERRTVLSVDVEDLDPAALRVILHGLADDLEAAIGDIGHGGLRMEYGLELRYRGQEHTLLVPVQLPDGAPDLHVPDDIAVQLVERFEKAYLARFGYLDPLSTIEVIEVEVVAERPLPAAVSHWHTSALQPGEESEAQVLFRGQEGPITTRVVPRGAIPPGGEIPGPAVIYELGATTVVPPHAVARSGPARCLVIEIDLARSGR
jgi:N-methylhydantoinase A